ncbi:MAG: hypothetical protein J6L83_05435 [Clostridia bacterium]|nr:hypothetical protein [Clostridia bacterium]
MKKFIVYIVAIILILCFAVVPVFATETESGDVIEEMGGASTSTTGSEITEEILTETEAETKDTWALIKSEFGADPQFWTVVMLCAVMAVLVVFIGFVLIAKVNPTSRKSMNGMAKAIDIVKDIKEENSQTLAKIVEDNAIFKEKVLELEDKLSRVESLDVKERHDLFLALFNDLRIHKLVCDRLAMPVNDKSIIDLWYSQGIEAIKDDISEDDLAFINRISEKLNGVGKKK